MSKAKFPLYHGTDLNIFTLSKEERRMYKEASLKLIPIFVKIYDENEFIFKNSNPWNSEEENKHRQLLQSRLGFEMYSKVCAYLGKAKSIGSKLYEYDNFYVTGYKDFAINYAENACYYGEIGSIAYYLIKGVELLDYKYQLPEDLTSSYKILIELWSKTPSPAIIKFENIDIENMLNEDESAIMNNFLDENCSYRFKEIPPITSEMIIKIQ